MKKIYSQPNVKVVKIHVAKMVASSIRISSSADGDGNVLGREDNSWDIWGSGDDEE